MEKTNDLFGEILRHGPSQSTLFLVLSKMRDESRFNEVVQECRKALSIYPDDLRLRTLLAESYLALGFIGLAETELTAVTKSLGDLISVYKLQAEIFNQQQRVDEAFEALKRYLAHKPDDRNALDLLQKMRQRTEEVLSEEPETALPPSAPEPGLDEKQTFGFAAGFENETKSAAEETDEKPLSESPELGGAMPAAMEDDLEAAHVLESPEIPEELMRAAEQVFEAESILESADFPKDIERSLEEEIEELSVAEITHTPDTLEDREGDEFGELATPELAEIYFHQGLINEAVSTYEKVLLEKPEDEASRERLAELKALNEDAFPSRGNADEILHTRKEKMIFVMKDWLAKIQELSEAR